MAIDFHAERNRTTYATRVADPGWSETIADLVDAIGLRIVDVGCGGGIYSVAWLELGAAEVTGIDFSKQMVKTASERFADNAALSFQFGDALQTGLSDRCADVVFERALIHHITDVNGCLREAHRILVPGGRYLIQDRTIDDICLPGTREHIRGYFFDCYPRLLDIETARRPDTQGLAESLAEAGYVQVGNTTIWETRRTYAEFSELAHDLMKRTGRSILHELTDLELEGLVDFIAARLPEPNTSIVEKDRWTIWWGSRR